MYDHPSRMKSVIPFVPLLCSNPSNMCLCVCMCVCMCVCLYVNICVCMCVCVCVCLYVWCVWRLCVCVCFLAVGDKTRMDQLSKSDDCYVRASPTRGVLGGIAEHTADVITLCEAGTVQYNTVQYSTVQYSTVRYDSTLSFSR